MQFFNGRSLDSYLRRVISIYYVFLPLLNHQRFEAFLLLDQSCKCLFQHFCLVKMRDSIHRFEVLLITFFTKHSLTFIFEFSFSDKATSTCRISTYFAPMFRAAHLLVATRAQVRCLVFSSFDFTVKCFEQLLWFAWTFLFMVLL